MHGANEVMRLDGGTQRVGIGITAPTAKLDITDNVSTAYDPALFTVLILNWFPVLVISKSLLSAVCP